MKKVVAFSLLLCLVFLALSSASAISCGHTAYVIWHRNGPWMHLSPTESGEYTTTHYRNVYADVYCKTCQKIVESYFDYTEWGSHTIPCSLCGAQDIVNRKVEVN